MNDPQKSAGLFTIRRPRRWQDLLRAYNVVVDGDVVGRVRPGSSIKVPVTEGAHTVQLTIDWTASNQLTLTVSEGEEARLLVVPPDQAAPGGLFQPDTWMVLRADDA